MFQRASTGPLLTRDDVPGWPPQAVDVSSVFNPGAVQLDGTTVLLARVQTRGRRTMTWPAVGTPDTGFRFLPAPATLDGLERLVDPGSPDPLEVFHTYDPRITRCGDRLLVTTALDTARGGRVAVWEASGGPDDGCGGLGRLEFLALTGSEDTRNGVLFPRRIGGRWLMLDRPNTKRPAGGPPTGDAVRLLASDDLAHWETVGPVFGGHPHYWDELVGAGPPPLETDAGWLLIYHGVATHFQGVNIYQAGAVLLDRDDPARVLGRTRDNLLEPRATWELTGQVPNVVFPSGLVVPGLTDGTLAGPDHTLEIYYGAADTCIGLARARVGEILEACS